MGTYLGVRAVEKNGEECTSPFSKQQPDVPPGKRLIGIPQNGLWKIAADLTRRSEYDSLYSSYAAGNWLDCKLYLLDEDKVTKCPDEGRVSI